MQLYQPVQYKTFCLGQIKGLEGESERRREVEREKGGGRERQEREEKGRTDNDIRYTMCNGGGCCTKGRALVRQSLGGTEAHKQSREICVD